MNPDLEAQDDDPLAEVLRRSGRLSAGPEPDEDATLAFVFGHATEEQRARVERSIVESPGYRERIRVLRAEATRIPTSEEREAFAAFEPEALTPLALKTALRRAGFALEPSPGSARDPWWTVFWTWRTGLALATATLLLVVGGPLAYRALVGTTEPDQVVVVNPRIGDSLPPIGIPADSSRPAPGALPGDSTAVRREGVPHETPRDRTSAPGLTPPPSIERPSPAPPEVIVQQEPPRTLGPGERIQFATEPNVSAETVDLAKRIALAIGGESGDAAEGRFLVEFGTLGSPQPSRAGRAGAPAPEIVRMLPYRVVDRWTGRSLPEMELRVREGEAAAATTADRLATVLRGQPWAGRIVMVRGAEIEFIGTGRDAPGVGERVRILERGEEVLRSDSGSLAGYRTRPVGVAVVIAAAGPSGSARVESYSSSLAAGMSVVRSNEP